MAGLRRAAAWRPVVKPAANMGEPIGRDGATVGGAPHVGMATGQSMLDLPFAGKFQRGELTAV